MAFGFGIGKNKVLVYSVDEFSAQVEDVVDPMLALKQDKHVTRTISIPGGTEWGWTTSENMYMQIVDVPGVTTSNTIIVSANPSGASGPSNQALYASCGVIAAAQQDGKIVFLAAQRPSSALSVNVVILGV